MVHGVVATVVVGVDSGCSAGRGSGPRRRVTGTWSRREGIDIKEVAARGRRRATATSLRDSPVNPRIATIRSELRCSGWLLGQTDLSTSTATGMPGRLSRVRPAGGRPRLQWRMPSLPLFPLGTPLLPGARLPLQLFEPRYLVLARDPRRARGGRPAVRRHAHPQGSRGRPRRGAGPARHRLRGPGRRDGPRRGRGRHGRAPRRHRGAPVPPRRHRRGGRHAVHHRASSPGCPTRRSPTTRRSRPSPSGRCARTPPTSPAWARRRSRSRRRCPASPTGSPSGWCSTRPTGSGCSRARMPRPGCAPCSPCCGARRPSSAGSGPCRPRPTRAARR